MKTKVWIVIWGLKDGGAEVMARNYAALVDRRAFDATIVTMYPFENTANYRYTKDAGIRVLSVFKKRNAITRMIRLLCGKWYIPFVLKNMLAKEKPHTIHFNSQMAYCFTSLDRQLSGVRLLYTCHSEAWRYFSAEETKAVQQLVDTHNLRLIALHDDMKNELNQLFSSEDTAVIRNGVDFTRFHKPGYDRNAVRESLGIARDAYLVGHVGRFAAEKNHMFLLEVFQKIVQSRPESHLLLVGSGDLKEKIKQEITRRQLDHKVTILSHRTDVPELLQAMDVVVFPSLFEGLSVTLVEAQVSGLKCVISSTINPANILSEKTFPVSLEAPAETWADMVLDDSIRNENHGNIEEYNMNLEIHRLERLYQGELEV